MDNSTSTEIWVHIDLRNEKFFRFGLNVLAKARELAEAVSGKTATVLLGSTDHDTSQVSSGFSTCMSAKEAADTCVAHGADLAFILQSPELAVPRADTHALALADAVKGRCPMLVLFALTDFGRELAARTARINNAGLIADCADLTIDQGKVAASCPSWGGEIMANITFADGYGTGYATVQPHILQALEVRGEPGTVERVQVDDLESPKRLQLISSTPELEEHRKLEEAEVVVVGGAGLGSPEAFGSVRELAAALVAEVGATRPPVLQHWVDERRLIGQTGKSVSPKLLFSVGTSGAVQYTAGITEAETIVAINRDQNAPIFQVADLGIVADCNTFLPLLTERVKQVVMRDLADVLSDEKGAEAKSTFGAKIRRLREARSWSTEALAKSTGQSPEFVTQVENDEIAPPVSFLLGLARALEIDPGTFLREEEKTVIRDQRAQAFTKRTENYSYETLTPGAEKEHLRAFMITIESRQAHKPVAYKHEGEEFIFVLKGDLELILGGKTHHLKQHESIRFNSDVPHKLKSLSDEVTRCLVVLYTP